MRVFTKTRGAIASATAAALLGALWRRRTRRDRAAGEIDSIRAPTPGVPSPPPAESITNLPATDRAAAEPPAHLSPRRATPPIETPGPSVPAPALPESETERAEWVDAHPLDPEFIAPSDDPLVAEQEAAAAAEAALIGGIVARDFPDPALDPVYQAGGGEQEGFEAAERDLIENATHGDGGANPLRDAFPVETEADRSSAVYGEADRLPSTEALDDPDRR